MMTFNAPSSKESVRPSDFNGHLLVIEVHKFKANFDTAYGPKDAIEVTVHDIDDEVTFQNALWFSTVLVSTLKASIGNMVLAWMTQGVGRPGQQPPWVLKDATGDPAAVDRAQNYLASQV